MRWHSNSAKASAASCLRVSKSTSKVSQPHTRRTVRPPADAEHPERPWYPAFLQLATTVLMTGHCLPRLRVFLDVWLLALLVLTAFALRRQVAKPKAPPKHDANVLNDNARPTFRRSVAVAALASEAWGVLGLVLSLEHNCPSSHWLVVLCLSLSGVCLLTGAWLSVREVLFTIDGDIESMLWCLRCLCCSRLTKRALLLPPLAFLVTLNAVSWLDCSTTESCNALELLSPNTFFTGATAVFLNMFVATLLAVGWPLVSRSCRVATSRIGKVVVALGLAAFALTSIGWAVVGLIVLSGCRNGVDPVTLHNDSCWDDLEVLHAAHLSITEPLVLGGLLILTTFCCRLENFFLAPHAPEVDLTQLSPRFATIKAPFEADDDKSAQLRTPQDVPVTV